MSFKYDVCVIGGCGHVGLPLAIAFASRGKRVAIYDVNERVVDLVSKGEMPFIEPGTEEILKENIGKRIFTFTDKNVISESQYLIIIIGTPVDRHLNPDFSVIHQIFKEIEPLLREGHHIVLRSTLYPGTTEKIYDYLQEKKLPVNLSFCPERIAEGKAMEELFSLPQIVSGFTEKGIREARALFESIASEIIAIQPMEAELAKLFNNVWRYIQFAISNQFYMLACERKLDFYNIYKAVVHNYPRAQGLPKAGFAAGPCLFKDTMQLSAFNNNHFFLGHSAMLINEGLPNFVVTRINAKYDLSDKAVGILGMAFKANSDDPRESLSYKLRNILKINAREVYCTDAHIKDPDFVDIDTILEKCDIIIVAAPHKEYEEINFNSKKVIDIWNFYGNGGLI